MDRVEAGFVVAALASFMVLLGSIVLMAFM